MPEAVNKTPLPEIVVECKNDGEYHASQESTSKPFHVALCENPGDCGISPCSAEPENPSESIIPTRVSRAVHLLGVPAVSLMHIVMNVEKVGQVIALLDSGASRSLINERLLTPDTVLKMVKNQQYRVSALGEDSYIYSIGTIDLTVEFGGIEMLTSFVIVPATLKTSSDVVLGRIFFENAQIGSMCIAKKAYQKI